jgi:hypothetical protein
MQSTYFFELIEFPSHVSTLPLSLSDNDSQNTGATASINPNGHISTIL